METKMENRYHIKFCNQVKATAPTIEESERLRDEKIMQTWQALQTFLGVSEEQYATAWAIIDTMPDLEPHHLASVDAEQP